MQIAFVGGGNMASALIGGLLQKGFIPEQLTVVEVDAGARQRLTDEFRVKAVCEVSAAIGDATLVVLAVKPQQLLDVARNLRPHLAGQLLVSIAAGIRTLDLSRWLGGYGRIVRVMPNTPALVLAGVSALYAMPDVAPDDRRRAEAVLSAVGATLWVEREELMDAVTAVSGSGPAYVFYFMEAVMQAATDLGLSAEEARRLTLETFYGAAVLARNSQDTPEVLRARVTSKGGTTERALKRLESEAVKQHIVQAVREAAERSRELGDDLGKGG
jgi:pyrroline-5-carboxylate reductase